MKIEEFMALAEIRKEKLNPLVDMDEKPCIELEHIESGSGRILGWAKSTDQKSIKNVFYKGDVLFGKLRPYLKKYWLAEFNGVCSSEIWVLMPKNSKVDPMYFFYRIQNNDFIMAANVSSGSKMPRADWNFIINYPLSIIHSIPEQRAIARVLKTWDTAIHTTEKLIAQKELRKKWLIQVLLTGKKRLKGFNNLWQLTSLEKFITPISRSVEKPKEPYLALGIRSHGKGTFLKENEIPDRNSMDKLFVVKENDLLVNITFAWEMAIAIATKQDDGALVSHRFPTFTFKPEIGSAAFFKFFILMPIMKNRLNLISPGGAGRNRVLNKSDFLKLEFRIPEYKEQIAIANIIQSADNELNLLEVKREKLKEQKRGLMQVLLTGKTKLKII